MKITNWAVNCSFVTVMAVSLVACGSKSNDSAESKTYGVKQMDADEVVKAGIDGVMVLVHTDDEGKPISREMRKIPQGVKINNLTEAEAEAVFANAETANDDTSADSFYSVGCGGAVSTTTVITTSSFNNGCNNWGNNWNNSSFSSSSFSQTTSMSSSSSGNFGPVFGCGSVGFACQNNAIAAWPGYWQNGYATPVRNFLFGRRYYPTPIRNFLFGYRAPFARAWGGGNRFMFGFPTCGSNWGGC